MVDHGAHCDADLRHDGCVCEPDWLSDDVLSLAEQEAQVTALAAEWAEWIAKGEQARTDELGREAFA